MTFKRISTDQVHTMIDNDKVTLVDIRDKASFLSAHIDEAIHLDNSNIDQFINDANQAQPLIVYCYHGNSSQGASDFLAKKGFEEVYSMDGGFEEWRMKY